MKRPFKTILIGGLAVAFGTGVVIAAAASTEEGSSSPTAVAQETGVTFLLPCALDGARITCSGDLPEVTSSTPAPSSTSSPTTLAPTTTRQTTVAPTSTSSAPTTSPAVPSTPPPTSTPPTSSSPAGVLFSEHFSTASSLARFDIDLHSGGCCDQPGPMEPAVADHAGPDTNCGNPNTTHRDLPGGIVPAPGRSGPFVNAFTYTFWCAPGGNADAAHMMTAYQTGGYVILSFSPKQVFTGIRKVCWTINATDGGGGEWTNMLVVPASAVKAKAPGWGPGVDLDFAMDFDLDTSATRMPTDSFAIKYFRGTTAIQQGGNEVFTDGSESVTADRAARFLHCVTETGPNTVTVEIDRPDGHHVLTNIPAHFPDGPVRVIFQDDRYNPDKHSPPPSPAYTWHWDDVEVS